MLPTSAPPPDDLASGPLVLIGPAGSGKSTLAAAFSRRRRTPSIDLDAIAPAYYAETGFGLEDLSALMEQVGRARAERDPRWEAARVHAVERVLADHPGAVIALGAGHTTFAGPDAAERVRRALARAGNVLWLEPSADVEESLAILRVRCLLSKGTDWQRDGEDMLRMWLTDGRARSMATAVVRTRDRGTAEQDSEAIASRLAARTERLFLDMPSRHDAAALHALWADERVWRHHPAGRSQDTAQSEARLADILDSWSQGGLGTWVVRRRGEDRPIGVCGCRLVTDPAHPDAPFWNLGYRFELEAQGHGYATEAAVEALRAAQDLRPDVPQVASVAEQNTPSVHVARRLGMELERRIVETDETGRETARLILADRPLTDAELAAVIAS